MNMDRFTYLGSCLSDHRSTIMVEKTRIPKGPVAYAGLRHLCRRCTVSLTLKGGVYCVAVRLFSLYGCKTRGMRVGDVCRLEVFDLRWPGVTG